MYEIGSAEEKRSFYKNVLALVIPMAIQNLINTGVQAADVVMLGKVGELEISAASLAGNVNFIMTLFFFGLTSGAAVLTAQYWGKRDIPTIEKILGIAMRLGLAVSVVFTLAALFFPEQIMHLYSPEPDVIKMGAKYMRIVATAYIPSAVTAVYLNLMRSVERVKISTVVYLVSLVTNVFFNYVFIFGTFGAPALGVVGAAVATAIARYVEFFIVVVYALFVNREVRLRPKYLFGGSGKVLLHDFFSYALPVTANELLWGSGVSVINAIIGHLGQDAVAANSVAQVVRQLAMVISFGIANATAIVLGKTIGEGKKEYAEILSKRFLVMSFVLGLCGSAMILAVSPFVLDFMVLGETSEIYLSRMLMVMAYYVLFSSLNCTGIVAIFRSGGDTKVGLVLDCGGLWCIAILFGAIAAFVLKFPVIIVYFILVSDEAIKFPFVYWRYKSKKWLKNVTRDF